MKYLLITLMFITASCKKEDAEPEITPTKTPIEIKVVTVGGSEVKINGGEWMPGNKTYRVTMFKSDTLKYESIGGNPYIETDIIQDTSITRYKGYKTLDIKYIVK